MQPSELMINNVVSYKGQLVKVTTNVLMAIERGSKNYTPIPLSPELLVKLGFWLTETSSFQNINMKYYVNNAVCLFFNDTPPPNTYFAGYGFVEFGGAYHAATFRWISYVHQLQNLFLALSGHPLPVENIM